MGLGRALLNTGDVAGYLFHGGGRLHDDPGQGIEIAGDLISSHGNTMNSSPGCLDRVRCTIRCNRNITGTFNHRNNRALHQADMTGIGRAMGKQEGKGAVKLAGQGIY